MEPATFGFIGTLVGAIVGATASIATTLINSRNAGRLQSNADELIRIERSRVFQRDTLLKTQESLQDSMRNLAEMQHLDVIAYRESGDWQKTLLGDELNQRVMTVNRELVLLIERISNDELRDHIKAFRDYQSGCIFTRSEEDGEARLKQAMDKFDSLMGHIGKVLRGHY